LIANNSPSNCDGAVTDRGHNLEFPASGCPGKVANPRLGPLQDNGGPAPTIALGSGSAALDAIPVNVSGCTNTDERGVRRPQGRACDIGAYEREAPVVVTRAPAHVTTKTAVLRGTVTPNAYGFAHFELIGPSGAIRRTGTVVLTGLKLLALTVRATGLTPGTRYRYRLVLERFDGTTSGAVRSFRTRRPRRRPR
jgi:hypothetical protein